MYKQNFVDETQIINFYGGAVYPPTKYQDIQQLLKFNHNFVEYVFIQVRKFLPQIFFSHQSSFSFRRLIPLVPIKKRSTKTPKVPPTIIPNKKHSIAQPSRII